MTEPPASEKPPPAGGPRSVTDAAKIHRLPWALLSSVFGSIYGNEPSAFFGGRGSVDVSVPRYMAMIIASVGMLSIAISMAVFGSSTMGICKS